MADRTVRGVLGRKLGMTQVFDASNRVVPVTVVQAGPCVVTQVRTPEKEGYSAVQLGYEELTGRQERKLNSPEKGHLRKNKLPLLRVLREVDVDGDTAPKVGDRIDVTMFAV